MQKYSWQESYLTAVLESDWTKMEERIQTAEAEMHKRRLALSKELGGREERDALVKAIGCLRVIRTDATVWLENQKLQA
jgi:hypothetical protein